MKQVIQKTGMALFALLTSILMLAQDKDKGLNVDVDVNKGGSDWYAQPWVWAIGAADFIIIIVAILKGGGRKEA
ncbi:MAG TPA: hypothetical protein VMZ03_01090 [Chitinophagaceae bacterium]|nr:hypothetical protein [Chitinophagaceae bacterium]